LNGLPTPAVRGVHAPLNHITTAVVTVRIVVCVRVIAIPIRIIIGVVVIVTVWEETESKAVSEIAIAETTTIMEFAATETTISETAGHPGTEAAALEAATVETATTKATVAATKAATSVATTSSSSSSTSAAPRQRHRRRSQANGRNCQ
jgi:hypothetical protein